MEKEPLYRLVTITDKFDFSLLEDEETYFCYSEVGNKCIATGKMIKKNWPSFNPIYLPHQEEKKPEYGHTKDEMRSMLEDVVTVLDLSD